jgi:hypothetical protein
MALVNQTTGRAGAKEKEKKSSSFRSNSKRRADLPMHRLSVSILQTTGTLPTNHSPSATFRGSSRTRYDLLVLLFRAVVSPACHFGPPSVTIPTARIKRHLTNQWPEPLFATCIFDEFAVLHTPFSSRLYMQRILKRYPLPPLESSLHVLRAGPSRSRHSRAFP